VSGVNGKSFGLHLPTISGKGKRYGPHVERVTGLGEEEKKYTVVSVGYEAFSSSYPQEENRMKSGRTRARR